MDANPTNEPKPTESEESINPEINTLDQPNAQPVPVPSIAAKSPYTQTPVTNIEHTRQGMVINPISTTPIIPEEIIRPIPVPPVTPTLVATTATLSNQALIQPTSGVPISPPKKKNLVWLWVTLGIIVVLIISLLTGYFVVKGNADKAADDYTTSLKSYLGQVYDDTSLATASPTDVKDSLSRLVRPQLKKVFLESISPKYVAAQALANTSGKKMDTLNSQIDGYVAVFNYHKAIDSLSENQKTTGDNLTDLANVLDTMQQAKALADKVQSPSDLKSYFEDSVKGYGDMIVALTTMMTAYKNGDQTSILKAYDDVLSAGTVLETAQKPIDTYFNNLSSKFTSSAKDIKVYSDSIE